MPDEAAFTEIEEAFFRAGTEAEEQYEAARVDEDRAPRRTLLRRLFSRKLTQR